MRKKLGGVYSLRGAIATVNLTPGRRVYGEKLLRYRGRELRLWNPWRSKLSAAIHKGLKKLPIEKSSRVLYLGAAQGTTPSHVSDIASGGTVYCVELSHHPMGKLLEVCTHRENMVPILGDASKPGDYLHLLEKVDILYQDIAHPRQVEVMLENGELFLMQGGYSMLAIKSRSISLEKPKKVYAREIEKLESKGFKVLQKLKLDPYEKDHAFVVARKL